MPRPRRAFALALMVLAVTTACMPDVPSNPTYTKDVQPILAAHCVRCHGANDMLNTMTVAGAQLAPLTCYLQRYMDDGDCTTMGSTTCKRGAGYCGTSVNGFPSQIIAYLNQPASSSLHMPPAPSDPLNDWEMEVITRWTSVSPPAP